MKTFNTIVSFAGLALATATPAFADAKGDLQAAVKKISDAKVFSIKARRQISPELIDGAGIPEKSGISALVQRPNKLYMNVVGDGVDRRLYFNGSEVALFDNKANVYVKRAATGTLDDLDAKIEEIFGFGLPLGDLITSKPSGKLITDKTEISSGGEGTVGDVACEVINGSDDDLEWKAWLTKAGGDLKKVQVVAKKLEGKPRLAVELVEIDLAATAGPGNFKFTPPSGATEAKIEPVEAVEKATQ